MRKMLVILGQNALGKTDLAIQLAKRFNGEIIACDSRQLYKGLDIGSGKLPSNVESLKKGKYFWEINGVRIWMYDLISPKRDFSVKGYLDKAWPTIERVSREKLPIIVGGSGLYLKALLEGLDFLGNSIDKNLRGKLEKEGVKSLQERLKSLNEEKLMEMNSSDKANPRRLIRAIELAVQKPERSNRKRLEDEFLVLKIGLMAPRDKVRENIAKRLEKRIKQGLIKEGEELLKEGLTYKRMRALGLEYRFLADLLEGKITKDEFKKILVSKINQYAKRQETWFKKDYGICWFNITDQGFSREVEKLVFNFLSVRIDH